MIVCISLRVASARCIHSGRGSAHPGHIIATIQAERSSAVIHHLGIKFTACQSGSREELRWDIKRLPLSTTWCSHCLESVVSAGKFTACQSGSREEFRWDIKRFPLKPTVMNKYCYSQFVPVFMFGYVLAPDISSIFKSGAHRSSYE